MKVLKKASPIFVAFILVAFAACQSPLNLEKNGQALPQSSAIISNEAGRYVDNVVSLYQVVAQNPAVDTDKSSDSYNFIEGIKAYFDKYPMLDKDGNKVDFSSLPESAQKAFLDAWKKDTAQQLVSSVNDAGAPIASDLKDLNDAIEVSGVLGSNGSRSLANGIESLNQQIQNLNSSKTQKFQEASQVTSDVSRALDSKQYDTSAIVNLINNTGVGYIITGFLAPEGSQMLHYTSFGGLFGHDSILSQKAGNQNWLLNSDAIVGVTATPDKVQWDTVGRWSNKKDWINQVQIGQVRYKYWQWTNYVWGIPVWGEYRFNYPSASDAQRAVNNAISYLGVRYSLGPDLNSTDYFWCSKLVWRSWYNVSSNWDLNWGHWGTILTPGAIIQTDDRYRSLANYTIANFK